MRDQLASLFIDEELFEDAGSEMSGAHNICPDVEVVVRFESNGLLESPAGTSTLLAEPGATGGPDCDSLPTSLASTTGSGR